MKNIYRIKKIVIVSMMMLSPLFAQAQQYQQVKEKAPLTNVSLASFVSQQRTLFNFGWKFQLVATDDFSTSFASPTLDDTAWRLLDLPHDFQFEQPWMEEAGGARGFKPMCAGWYRKSFTADPIWKGNIAVR